MSACFVIGQARERALSLIIAFEPAELVALGLTSHGGACMHGPSAARQ